MFGFFLGYGLCVSFIVIALLYFFDVFYYYFVIGVVAEVIV